jgi:lysophospholipid acyltransferase (LPLAT)-like uncharacterized protein
MPAPADGEFIAQGGPVWVLSGSRRKGGVQTLRRMADWCRRGYSCGMIADGSRGPARVSQKGPLYLARETQAAILPVAGAARRKVTFDTWDRFELPLPLGRIALLVENLRVWPISRPALELKRLELEARLTAPPS